MRQVAKLGHVQVAVERECERARNRRRRHVQGVCAVRIDERRPLLDPEPVLLVDDDQQQPGELDLALEQRVGADDEARIARCDPLAAGALLGGRHVARHEIDVQRERLDQRPHGGGVLLGERLGRRHQRRLAARFDGAQHRVHRDRGLARADVADQQAPHRARVHDIAIDLPDRARLPERERERQRAPIGLRELTRLPEGNGGCRGIRRAPPFEQRELQQQQLLVGQPIGRPARFGEVARVVQGADRVAPHRQLACEAQPGRQRILDRVRRCRCCSTSSCRVRVESARLASYTGTSPSVWMPSAASARISCSRTVSSSPPRPARVSPRACSTWPGCSARPR